MKSGIMAEMVEVTAEAMAEVMDELANGIDEDILAEASTPSSKSEEVEANEVFDEDVGMLEVAEDIEGVGVE